MSELKPCPFCGKKPNPNWTDESYIECTNRKCSVYGYGMSTGDWNTRPIEDALNAHIAELGLELGRKSVELGELVGRNILWEVINDELKSRREYLERENDRLQEKVSDLLKRIAELERDFDMLFRSSANKQPRKNTQTLTFEYGMESEE